MKKQMTIKQFKQLTDISKDETLLPIEKEIAVIKVFRPDLTDKEIEKMDFEEFNSVMDVAEVDPDTKIKKEFRHNGVLYTLDGDSKDFKFNIKQMLTIQKAMRADSTNYLSKVMAAVYVTKEEIDKESVFFENMTMDYVSPFLSLLSFQYAGQKDFTQLV